MFSVALLRAYDAPNSGRAGIRVGVIISLIDGAGMDQVTCLSWMMNILNIEARVARILGAARPLNCAPPLRRRRRHRRRVAHYRRRLRCRLEIIDGMARSLAALLAAVRGVRRPVQIWIWTERARDDDASKRGSRV